MGMSAATIGKGPGSVGEVQSRNMAAKRAALLKLAAAQTPMGVSAVPGMPTGAPVKPLYDPAQVKKAQAAQADEGFQWGDIGDALGAGLKKGIEIIDTPRAWVASGVKELNDAWAASDMARWLGTKGPDWLVDQRTDAEYTQHLKDIGAEGGFEMDDFTSQAKAHKGMGDYITEISPDRSLTFRRTIGFMGDIAADPFTYASMGGATIVKKGLQEGVETGVRQAVANGGRDALAQALAKRAHDVGLFADDAVKKVIANAGTRGRGAITRKALVEAGLDAAKIEQLGIPEMSRAFLGMEIKGSTRVAEAVESTKGSIKKALGERASAEYVRAAVVSNKNGKRAIQNLMRSAGKTDADKATAALLGSIANGAKVESRGWAGQLAKSMEKDLAKPMRSLDDQGAVALTHAVEGKVLDETGAKVAGVFERVLTDLQAAGVDVSALADDGLGYVPHYSTRAARMSDNADVQRIVRDRDLNSRASFQNQRELVKNETFLGQKLVTGSIEEINTISEKQLGFKVFEDDMRNILPRYVAQAEEVLNNQMIRNGMTDKGIATRQRMKFMLDDDEAKALAKAEADAKEAWNSQTVALSDGTKVRYDAAAGVRKYLRQQRKAVEGELEALRAQMVTNARNRGVWSNRANVLRAELPHLEQSVQFYRRQAARLRGVERKSVLGKLRRAEAALDVKATELGVLEKRLAALPEVDGNIEDWAARHAVGDTFGEAEALTPQVAELNAKVSALKQDHEALLQANTPIGERAGVPYEQAVQDQQKALDWSIAQIGKDEAAVLDSRWKDVDFVDKIGVAEAKLAELDKALESLSKASKMVKPTKKNAIGAADHAAMRDEFQRILDTMKLIAPSDNPGLKAMVEAQLDGALLDMAALRAGRKATTAEDIIKALKDPNFGSIVKYKVDSGFADIGRGMQVPGWVDDMFKVEQMIKDPKHFAKAADLFKWFHNMWKGYATMRPGFVTRNTYSSVYSFYLEAGSSSAVQSALRDFKAFHRMFSKNPDGYMEQAVARFGAETAGKLDEALKVVHGSGGGLAVSEVASNTFRRSKKINVFSQDFAGMRAVRKLNENVEASIRGAHAYDVLRRGGDANTALATVEKWHFNYKDITDFDRAVKYAVPFWMFYSRNTALQAHVFTHDLAKFNRSFMNFRRQMELDQEQDPDAPDYVKKLSMIPTSVDALGEDTYMPLDVGPTGFANTLDTLGDPKRMVSDVGLSPLLGLPLQTVAGENLFTGAPNDKLRSVDPLTDKLMPWLQEGGTTGRGTMTQLQQDIYRGLLPGLSQGTAAARAADNGDLANWFGGYLGFPTVTVKDGQRQGVRYGRKQESSAAAAKRKILAGL